MTVPTAETAVAEIERLLDVEQETFYRLPAVEITATPKISAALADFRTRDVAAGREAAAWLRDCALGEHLTSRTVLLLGRGRVWGFYALASTSVAMEADDRAAAGVTGTRKTVPASLLAWIARDPAAEITGREMCLHAIATCRQSNELQASAVMVLDAWDDATEEMWLGRSLGLRKLRNGRKHRLWLP